MAGEPQQKQAASTREEARQSQDKEGDQLSITACLSWW